jgi:hypothetical protein
MFKFGTKHSSGSYHALRRALKVSASVVQSKKEQRRPPYANLIKPKDFKGGSV